MSAPIATAADAEALLAAAGARLYVDASPLIDHEWTGIPVVAAGLARAALARFGPRARCFYADTLLATPAVADALRRGTGRFLWRDYERGAANAGPLKLIDPDGTPAIGLFPSVKQVRGLFDIECSIVHDLSTLVTPLFHHPDNIRHHMQRVLADLATDDVTACVSEATRADLMAYLAPPEDQLILAPPGLAWPDWFALQAENEVDPDNVEPFCLILGTREPRKNILRVLEMLADHPELLATHRFVFAGREGWARERLAAPLRAALDARRIVFAGFVPEFVKYKLLLAAEATLYPSLFEGFGLPVLESLSVGTPCVTSWSSSLPEIAGDQTGADLCWYHDPLSAADLYRALSEVLRLRPKRDPAYRARAIARAAGFTWDAMLDRILIGIAHATQRKRSAGRA